MENQTITAPEKTFENINGDTLKFNEIIESKQVTLIKFSYLTRKREVRAEGIKGFFGFKVLKQEEEEVIITDVSGIAINFDEKTGTIKARFSNKKEFEKINNLDFDESTLLTSYVMNNVDKPCLALFHVQNLQGIFWQDD